MRKSKAAQIADYVNENAVNHSDDYRRVAAIAAERHNAGIHWRGTAALSPTTPTADVWHVNKKGEWSRPMGGIVLGCDGKWRAFGQ